MSNVYQMAFEIHTRGHRHMQRIEEVFNRIIRKSGIETVSSE